MYDRFNRKITYLRVSVTDRCNLRCRYCMGPEGITLIPHDQVLRYEEIIEFVTIAAARGITKVRLTGGEPLVRKGIVSLVEQLSVIEGIDDLAMTTNGTLLDRLAEPLKQAGLHRLNISLDTMDPEQYRYITRMGSIDDVLRGIEAAAKAGFSGTKINTVIESSPDEPDAQAVKKFAEDHNLEIRFIRKMDLEKGEFWPVIGGRGGICSQCNRIRLTSDGMVRPCLFSNLGYSIRDLGMEKAMLAAVENKPEHGGMNHVTRFYNVGG